MIIIAYVNQTGNWRLIILKGNYEDEGDNDILSMNTNSPNLSPFNIIVSITHKVHLTTINLVLLQRPSFSAIFLNNIIRQLTFHSSLNGGNPIGLREFKYSLGYLFVYNQF